MVAAQPWNDDRTEPGGGGLLGVLERISDVPAYVTGRRGDVLAWNDLAAVLYGGDSVAPDRRNVLRFCFGQPEMRRFIVDWPAHARAAVEAVRETCAGHEDDPWVQDLVQPLRRSSAEFAVVWDRASGAPTLPVARRFRRPAIGSLGFSCTAMSPVGGDGLRLWTYLPSDDRTTARLRSLAAARRRQRQRGQRRARAVTAARAHIDERFSSAISLDELAAVAAEDRFALLRWFTADVGMPPHGYQLLLRVDRARQLLAQGGAAADVALQVGFGDQSHLIRHFRRLEGVTPGEFVRRFRTGCLTGPPVRGSLAAGERTGRG